MYVAKAALQQVVLKVLYEYHGRSDANAEDYVMLQNIACYLRNRAYPYRSSQRQVRVLLCRGESMNILIPADYLIASREFRYLREVGE